MSAERKTCERCSRRVEVMPGQWGRIYSGRLGMERLSGLFLCKSCLGIARTTHDNAMVNHAPGPTHARLEAVPGPLALTT